MPVPGRRAPKPVAGAFERKRCRPRLRTHYRGWAEEYVKQAGWMRKGTLAILAGKGVPSARTVPV